MITVLAGGVGAARFLSGLVQLVDPEEITVIVNTADDFVLHGLSISPDIDTIRYTLTEDVGELGWGRKDETWWAMAEMKLLANQAPDVSRASDWFSLGDRDLATHLYRSQRLSEGADLTQVTQELNAAAGLKIKVLPMTNDRVSTFFTLDDGEVIDFQEYFVKRQHADAVTKVEFSGALHAKASREALDAIADANRVIIAPSNPMISIGPLLALPELASVLRSQRAKTVAISPLIGGKAVKGPADHLMQELGLEPNIEGIAGYLSDYASALVADFADVAQRDDVVDHGMRVSFTQTLMSTPERARSLAEAALAIPLNPLQ